MEDLPPVYQDQDLPSYETITNTTTAAPPTKTVLGPATLYISGRFIYSADPQAPPLYEFSHSIGYLHDADRSVKVERVDQVVKTSSAGTTPPQVVLRNRHLFDLKHPTAAEFPNFAYHAEAATRRVLCSFGASAFRVRGLLRHGKGYRFERVARGADRKLEAAQDDDAALFEANPSRDRAVGYEWRDARGELMAREVKDEAASMSLVITAEMSAEMRDVLVAAWIIRIWWELSNGDYSAMRLMMVRFKTSNAAGHAP